MFHMKIIQPTQTTGVCMSHAIKIHHFWRWASWRTTLRSSASLGTLVALHFSQAFLNHMFPFLRMSPPGTSSWSFFTLSGIYRSIDFRIRLKYQNGKVIGVAHGYHLKKNNFILDWGKIWKQYNLWNPGADHHERDSSRADRDFQWPWLIAEPPNLGIVL